MRRVLLLLLLPLSSWAAPVFVGAHDFVGAEVTVLDARTVERYAKGHVPGALSAPWTVFTTGAGDGSLLPAAELQAKLRALGVRQGRPVVVYARWREGWGEEGRLFWMLDYLGHSNVRVIRGGWGAWRGPVAQGAGETVPGDFTARVQPQRRVGTAQLALKHTSVDLIDTRSAAEFAGETPYGSKRGGHVPGARHLYWKGAFEADGRLRSRAAVRAWLEAGGVQFTRPAVAYCTGGIRSGFTYLLLRWLDHPSPANYDGSWWAWSADPQRAVAR